MRRGRRSCVLAQAEPVGSQAHRAREARRSRRARMAVRSRSRAYLQILASFGWRPSAPRPGNRRALPNLTLTERIFDCDEHHRVEPGGGPPHRKARLSSETPKLAHQRAAATPAGACGSSSDPGGGFEMPQVWVVIPSVPPSPVRVRRLGRKVRARTCPVQALRQDPVAPARASPTWAASPPDSGLAAAQGSASRILASAAWAVDRSRASTRKRGSCLARRKCSSERENRRRRSRPDLS